MHSDDLVTEDIGAGCQALGDGDSPGVVVGNQVFCSPLLGVKVNAGLVNLDPLECGLVDGGAGIIRGTAVGDVGQDGANVGFGPLGPVCKSYARLVFGSTERGSLPSSGMIEVDVDSQKSTLPPAATEPVLAAFSAFLWQMMSALP